MSSEVMTTQGAVGSSIEPNSLAKLCAQTGLILMQHGTESAVVELLTRRLGLAAGADFVEVALMANAVTVTVMMNGESVTVVRRNEDRGINMHMAMEVQGLVLGVELKEITIAEYETKLASIKPFHYPRWLVVLAVGLSCACFARLAQADWQGCAFAFLASSCAMAVRQFLVVRHFNPMVGFFVAAFIATSIAAQSVLYQIGGTPKATIAASILLLVPGFPLLTGISDMVKGYANTGISRITIALWLAITTCAGIILSLNIWDFWEYWHSSASSASVAVPMTLSMVFLGLVVDMFLAAVPALGFAMLFNVPVRILQYAALGGALGHGFRYLLLNAGVPIEWGSLVAAATVSTLGVYLARKLRAHPKVFSVAAMIPMVPGVPFFTALIALHELNRNGFSEQVFATVVTSGLTTFFIMAALALGLAMPGMLFYRRKSVV